jgi:DNA-binding MarR family transcriptional regulator
MADHPLESPSTNPQIGSYPGVEALLAEVNALANRLNQVGRGQEAPAGLPAAAYGVLQSLERHGSQTVPQIALRRSTSRQNIQMLINRLQGQGCVELTSNPAHRRSALVSLTGRGRALVLQGAEAYNSMLKTLASDIAKPELASATRLLNGLRHLLTAETARTTAVSRQRKISRPRGRRPPVERLKKESPAVPGPATANVVAEKISPDEEEFPVSLL